MNENSGFKERQFNHFNAPTHLLLQRKSRKPIFVENLTVSNPKSIQQKLNHSISILSPSLFLSVFQPDLTKINNTSEPIVPDKWLMQKILGCVHPAICIRGGKKLFPCPKILRNKYPVFCFWFGEIYILISYQKAVIRSLRYNGLVMDRNDFQTTL